MFEDQPVGQSNPPQNLPTEPVDMFAGLDEDKSVAPVAPGVPVAGMPSIKNALSAGLLKPKVMTPPRRQRLAFRRQRPSPESSGFMP